MLCEGAGLAQANMYDPEMCFVFDNRPPEVQRYTGTVYDAFARWVQPPPALRGLCFQSSTKEPCLQTADMIAWELHRYGKRILAEGLRVPTQPELLHLKENMPAQPSLARW